MGGEGHMLDMIRRLKEGRDSAGYDSGRDGTHHQGFGKEKRKR